MCVSKDVLKSEMAVVKNCIMQFTEKNCITLNYIKKVLTKNVFPNFYKLFQVAMTIPISSSFCERSFSAMRRIKIWLRTSMLQERFNNTSILYIEKNITKCYRLPILLLIYLQKKID